MTARRAHLLIAGIAATLAVGCAHAGTKQESPDASAPTNAGQAAALADAEDLYRRNGLRALTVAVASGDDLVWAAAFGWVDDVGGPRADTASLFRVGSVSKLLTATAAALLVDRGALDLDRPARDYFAAVPASVPPITARLLAGHLAGIRHYGRSDYISTRPYSSVDASLPLFVNDSLIATPGLRYSYSSYGYNLLGALLERASGKEFRQLVEDQVLRPLGLRSIMPSEARPIRGEVAYFNRDSTGRLEHAPFVDQSDRWPSGGYVSSAGDLARFGARVWRPGFLTPGTRALLVTPQMTRAGEATIVGLGWRIGTDSAGRRIVHHGGQAMGSRAVLVAYPDRRIAVALLTNLSFAPVNERDAMRLADLIIPR